MRSAITLSVPDPFKSANGTSLTFENAVHALRGELANLFTALRLSLLGPKVGDDDLFRSRCRRLVRIPTKGIFLAKAKSGPKSPGSINNKNQIEASLS
jgi:hypothetical protein